MSPPRKLKLCWGRGRSPQPLPSRQSWGGGEIIGAARPRQQHRDWLTRVTCQPSPSPQRVQFSEGSWGSRKGPRELPGPGLFPETRSNLIQLLLHIPAPYPAVNDPVPPQLASPYGFSMAAAARERALRRRKVRPDWGRGKEAAGRTAVRRRPGGHFTSRGASGSARGGWGGSGRGALACCDGLFPAVCGLAGRRTAVHCIHFPQV